MTYSYTVSGNNNNNDHHLFVAQPSVLLSNKIKSLLGNDASVSDHSDEHELEKRRFNAWAGKRNLLAKRRFNAWAGRR